MKPVESVSYRITEDRQSYIETEKERERERETERLRQRDRKTERQSSLRVQIIKLSANDFLSLSLSLLKTIWALPDFDHLSIQNTFP